MQLDRFLIEDVRCFKGPQEVRIRPLTFLVGENSTGKTTVLGCMQALADYVTYARTSINFNRHPYEMGSFREVVRRSRPVLDSFRLGATIDGDRGCRVVYKTELAELRDGARAEVKSATWIVDDAQIVMRRGRDGSLRNASGFISTVSNDGTLIIPERHFDYFQARPWKLPTIENDPQTSRLVENMSSWSKDIELRRALFSRAISIAPVRSRPERTYNPFSDAADAEGTEVPAAIASVARKGGRQWDELKAQLDDFGKETGLFSQITVKKLGKSGSDPFQLQVKARGPKSNLVDVGYGVSQILPILVHLTQARRFGMSLIQQPEVHLHPQAQAALASILIGVLGRNRHRRSRPGPFVIETHSDYMLDRTRIAIRQGKIAPDDVSFVYFEPSRHKGVSIHNITFDEMANMENAPNTYRQFFLRETNAFLGLAD